MKTRLFLTSALVISALVACGGDPKEAKAPESNSGITETSAKEDMPPPPAKEVEAPATAAATSGGAAGGMLALAPIKLAPAKKTPKDKAVELQADGTITVDGKPAAKVKGDQVDSIEGTSMVTIGVDGSLVGNGVKPGSKFEGDDLVMDNGAKLSVAEDGSITSSKDGKTETVGKAEGGAAAKRTALVLAALYLTIPAPDAKKITTPAPDAKKTK